MTEPRWQFLDNRERPGGGWTVYHWPLDVPEKVCEDSREVIHKDRDRCASHAGGWRPCRFWMRTPECDHRFLDPQHEQPHCLTCGLDGEDVTEQMGA